LVIEEVMRDGGERLLVRFLDADALADRIAVHSDDTRGRSNGIRGSGAAGCEEQLRVPIGHLPVLSGPAAAL